MDHRSSPTAPLPAFCTQQRNRRALLITYGASHIAKIAPVMRILERQGIECILIALTIGYKKAIQLGLKPLGYRDFLPLLGDRAEAVVARGRTLLSGNTHPEVDEHETCCYLGINYQEWVDEMGEAGAHARYAERGRRGFLPVRFMGQVLDALEPGIVIATSTPRSEEACIRAAVERGIPTLTMVDLFAPPSDPFLKRPVQADRITVMSQEMRTRFLANGLSPDQVVVCGSPDFDELFDPSESMAGKAFLQRQGWQGRKVVLWAGILEPNDGDLPGPALGEAVEARLRNWVRSTPDTALVVRYHPSEYHQFPDMAPQANVHISIPRVEAIAPLLHAVDVVIHQVSTVGLQAALIGKRVLHLGFSAWVQKADFDLGSLGSSEEVRTLDELAPMLSSARPLASERKMTVPSGPAAPRVADVVTELLNRTWKVS